MSNKRVAFDDLPESIQGLIVARIWECGEEGESLVFHLERGTSLFFEFIYWQNIDLPSEIQQELMPFVFAGDEE